MTTINESVAQEILERLTRLEALVVAHQEETNRRLDDVNRQFGEVNQRFGEVNRRIDETNQRIDETNRRVDQRVDRLEDRVENLDARMTSRMDKLFYTMIGLGAAVIASLVAAQILD